MLAEAYYPLRRPSPSRQFYGEDGMRLNLTPPVMEELRTEFGMTCKKVRQLSRAAIPLAATIFLGYSAEASAQGPKGAPAPSFPVCETVAVVAGVATLAFLRSRISGKKQEPKKQDGGVELKVDPFTGR